MKIWKFPLDEDGPTTIEGAERLLSVGLQDGAPVVWALMPEDPGKGQTLVVDVVATGEEFSRDLVGTGFLGTVQLHKDRMDGYSLQLSELVLHVFWR